MNIPGTEGETPDASIIDAINAPPIWWDKPVINDVNVGEDDDIQVTGTDFWSRLGQWGVTPLDPNTGEKLS